MRELIPAVKALWQGDYEHQGEFWQFPKTTSSPMPVQQPHPPIWVAARDPMSHTSYPLRDLTKSLIAAGGEAIFVRFNALVNRRRKPKAGGHQHRP